MITSKVSLHLGSRFSTRHNLRQFDERWNTDGHINKELSCFNEILVNVDVKQFFDSTFGDALMEYNAKNEIKHPERVFGLSKAEYEKAVKERGQEKADELRRQKAVGEYYQQQKKNIKECITQLGDEGEFRELVALVGADRAREIHVEYLKDFLKMWQEKNPTLKVFCATIHLDESTPHLHLDYIPVAQSVKGLTTKVSVDGALSELGYKRSKNEKYSETSWKRWLKDFRADNEQRSQSFLDKKVPKTFLILPSEHITTGHTQPEQHKAEVNKSEMVKQAIGDFFTGKGRLKEQAVNLILENANVVEKAVTAQANEVLAENKRQAQINKAFNEELKKRADSLQLREEKFDKKSEMLRKYEQSLVQREGVLNQKLLTTVLQERQAREPMEINRVVNERFKQKIGEELKERGQFKYKGGER